MTIFNDRFNDKSDDFHPIQCSGVGKCIHCDRTKTDNHNPKTCQLCAPYFTTQYLDKKDNYP